jgi:Uma2 family endonuclease
MLKQPLPSAAKSWPEPGQWTYDDWLLLPDDGTRYEIIDGELFMTPPPSVAHQTTSGNLHFAMQRFVRERNLGRVLAAPLGVHLPGQPVPFQPDIVYVAEHQQAIISAQYIEGVPDLLVEILSPSNWPYDRKEKFRVYQEASVPELWLVDYRNKTVEVFAWEGGEYVLQQGVLGTGDTVRSRALAGFTVPVIEIFRDV